MVRLAYIARRHFGENAWNIRVANKVFSRPTEAGLGGYGITSPASELAGYHQVIPCGDWFFASHGADVDRSASASTYKSEAFMGCFASLNTTIWG